MKKNLSNSKTLLIGSGRLAKHLQHYCKLLKWKIHRKIPQNTNAESLLTRQTVPQLFLWDRGHKPKLLENSLEHFDQIWLAISDSSLEAFVDEHLKNFKGTIIQFSGALEIPGTTSVHPLMTFSKPLYSEEIYRKILFVHTTKISWNKHFPLFKNPHHLIKPEQKIIYHLLCVMLGNFSQILLNAVTDQFKRIGINKHYLSIYIEQCFKNQQQLGWQGLTGPFVRNDQQTIRAHLKVLSKQSKSNFFSASEKEVYQKIYRDFQSLYLQRTSS